MPADPYLGEIFMGGYNFAPLGYALCQGQLLAIADHPALFSLIGTTYGGDGETTFALPDLRGRVPIGMGQGQGLSDKYIGEVSGTETVTLLQTQIPAHNHLINAVSEPGDGSSPQGAYLANSGALDREYKTTGTIVNMNANAVGATGGSEPHNNMQPYLVLNIYIALEGIYPQP